jgi:hypothetical protein
MAHIYVYHIFFIQSFIVGHLNWLLSLAILNRAAVNMGMQVSLLYVDFHSIGYMPKSGMAGSQSRSIFRFWGIPYWFS